MKPIVLGLAVAWMATVAPMDAAAQSGGARPWSRVSFFSNSSETTASDGVKTKFTELTTAFAYQLPDEDRTRADFGVDLRYATYASVVRPNRASIYEGFVGGRLANGRVRVRFGHVSLNDMGSLGALAGGVVELVQLRPAPDVGRLRLGFFGGLEPNILDTGYAPNVKKAGAYLVYEGAGARRSSLGFANIRNGGMTERSVLTTTNFVPVGKKLFVFQSAEFDLQAPAGQAERGLAYLFATGRFQATDRLELQGTYNRGRSVDARGLSEDILAGRPVAQQTVDGLLYESIGGRVTVEALRRVRVYAGYSRDKNNRDTDPSGRTLVGGYASNIAGSGLDVSASDSLLDRPGGSYHSRYVSVGRQIRRVVYVSGDVTTSLSVIRYSRSDGITVETRPSTVRYSGTATINVGRSTTLLATVERSVGDDYTEFRVLSGLTYRIR